MRRTYRFDLVPPAIVLALALVLWFGIAESQIVTPLLLPSPLDVCRTFAVNYPVYLYHTFVTVLESQSGLVLALLLSVVASALIAAATWFDRALSPWIVAGQAFPKEALTPLLAVWLGYSMLPKALLSASICFFPITIALSKGLLTTDAETVDMLRVLGASRSQQFFMYRLPNSLSSLMTGLRIAFPLSLIGAVVGELWGSSAGLGYLIRVNRAHLDPAFVFGCLILLAFLGVLDFIVVACIERALSKYLDHTSPIRS